MVELSSFPKAKEGRLSRFSVACLATKFWKFSSKGLEETMSRLEEIKEQMEDLLEEAMDEVRSEGNEVTRERAYGYWYAHIKTALTNEHMFLGGSMCTMEDTVKELENEECQTCGEEALERDDNDNPICYDCNVA